MGKKVLAFVISLLSIICLVFYGLGFVESVKNASASKTNQLNSYTVIIDAGHGGADGGAVGSDGISEKSLNLSIAIQLDKILNSFGVKTVMTRTTDDSIHSSSAKTLREQKVSDIHNRMDIMNTTENALFVSIHQNKFENSSLWGTQVFYSPNTTESAVLADLIQQEVKSLIQKDNNRVIKKSGSSIYLLYYAKKTAVLVECGFVSNPQENKLLETTEYQNKMAFSIAMGIMEYIDSKDV